jgi:hypothetical protein
VNREGRFAHPSGEGTDLVVRDEGLRPDSGFEVGVGDVDRFVEGALRVGEGRDLRIAREVRSNPRKGSKCAKSTHLLLNSRHQNLSLRRHQLGEQRKQVRHRFVNDVSKDSRVKVSGGTFDLDGEVGETAEAVGEAGGGGAEPV